MPASLEQRPRESPASLFRNTFDPNRVLLEPEVEEFRVFLSQLLALRRPQYEAVMRAIKRIVRATRQAIEDPTVAYTDFVAALESLSAGEEAPAAEWRQLDGRKRKLLDAALADAPTEVTERVRAAIMEADRLGLGNRFRHFVLSRVSPQFFRSEAVGAIRPMRGADLERAVKRAYEVRSRSVHSLWDLPPEAWVLGDRADTVVPDQRGTMLSLEGLSRLARHVVRAYVAAAPTGVDSNFDWRASTPGQVRVRVAPQYWMHLAAGFATESSTRYFHGFVEYLVEVLADRAEGVPDMSAVLERIEHLVPGLADGPAKREMMAIYALWHRVMVREAHRERADAFLARHGRLVEDRSLTAFVVELLTGDVSGWSTDAWVILATERRAERAAEKVPSLPPGIDAALQVWAAERLVGDGRGDEAVVFARHAVEELPGDEQLIAWEAALAAGEEAVIDLRRLVFGVASEDPAGGD